MDKRIVLVVTVFIVIAVVVSMFYLIDGDGQNVECAEVYERAVDGIIELG